MGWAALYTPLPPEEESTEELETVDLGFKKVSQTVRSLQPESLRVRDVTILENAHVQVPQGSRLILVCHYVVLAHLREPVKFRHPY